MSARIFSEFILGFNDAILSVIDDMSVNRHISRFAGPTQLFGGAHRDSVCVRARTFIGVSVRSCM
jgi:hypothetical protein